MESLVRNLLDASAIEAGTLSMRFAPVHVDTILETTAHLCQPLADRKSIVLEAGSEVDLLLVCDGDRIQQALESLVGNALKLLPAEGEVVLCVRAHGGEVVFEVRDSGPGIPPDQIGRVFDRYWRGSGGASTGLGLYVAKAIVEGHGGRIGPRAGTVRTRKGRRWRSLCQSADWHIAGVRSPTSGRRWRHDPAASTGRRAAPVDRDRSACPAPPRGREGCRNTALPSASFGR